MATTENVEPLKESIIEALTFQEKSLVSRPEWGSITFDAAEADLGRIFTILSQLQVLPLEYLTDQAINQINTSIAEVLKHLTALDEFNIEQSNPHQVRDSLVNTIHQQADQFYTVSTPWIPFLAYQKGDVSQNIQALAKSVQDANEMVEQAQSNIQLKSGEIEQIITKTREASAAAGAAVFTQDFTREAQSLKDSAKNWLIATIVLSVLTALSAAGMWIWVEAGLDNGQLIQKFGSKLAVLAMLFTATLWCGRIYKAQMHQSTINNHRALSLQTFQAFSSAAADVQTKEAVLLETTKAIFAHSPSGYIDSESQKNEQDFRVIELARTPSIVKAVDPKNVGQPDS